MRGNDGAYLDQRVCVCDLFVNLLRDFSRHGFFDIFRRCPQAVHACFLSSSRRMWWRRHWRHDRRRRRRRSEAIRVRSLLLLSTENSGRGMPFLKRMHRAILLPLVLRPRICMQRVWMRTRAKTSVEEGGGKNTFLTKKTKCFFFGRKRERKRRHFFTRNLLSSRILLSLLARAAHDAPPFEDESDDNRRRCKKKK